MPIMNALKERIELAERMARHVPVTAFNIRLGSDGALADLMVNGQVFKDQPYIYTHFFSSWKLRQFTLN